MKKLCFLTKLLIAYIYLKESLFGSVAAFNHQFILLVLGTNLGGKNSFVKLFNE